MPSIGPRIGIQGEKTYRQALMRMISETKSLNAEMELMTAKFKDNQTAMSKNKELASQYSKILESAQKNVTNFKDALEKATAKHENAKQKQAELNAQLEEAKKQFGDNSKEVKELEKELAKWDLEVEKSGKNVNEWQTKLYEAEKEVVDYQKKLEEASASLMHFGEDLENWGGKIADVGDKLTQYVTTPLAAIGTASIKASSDFTDGMAKIYTIATESQKPMAEMRSELEQLSASSAFGLEDLTEATYQAVSASVDTAHAVGFVNDATRLARAGFTDTTMAVDLLTTAINAYGYKAEDAAYISDVLLKTQNDGKTIINELAGSMGTVIPTAAAYNVSLENLAAAYVMMTKQGINTARSTTFLNSMFTELERASSDVSKILAEKTGKSFAQLMDEGKSLGDVLGILYDAVGKDDEAFARLWKNVRAGRGGLALVNTGVDAFNTALERVSNSAGQTQYALDVLETPSLKAKRALNQLKIEGVELGDALITKLYPTFEKVVSVVSNVTDKIMAMDDGTMDMIVTTGMIVAAVGPALSIGGRALKLIGKIALGIAKMNILYPGLLSGIVSTVGPIALATSAYIGLGAAAKKMQDERFGEIEQEYQISNAMKASIQNVNDLKTAYDGYAESVLKEKDAAIQNADYATYLTQKYNELVGENGKLKEGTQALADTLINELAQTLGISVEETRKLIEKNGQFGESIEKNIAQIKQRAEMAAYEDLYTEAIKRKIAAEDENVRQQEELRQAHLRTEEAQRQYDQALQEYNAHLADGTAKTGGYEDRLQDAQSALIFAKDAEEQLATAVNDSYEVVQQATDDINTYGQKMLEAGGASAQMSQAISENTGKALDSTEALKKGAEQNLNFDGYNIGKAAIIGYANGMNDQKRYVISTASTIANAANKAMCNTLEIKSPSRVMKEVGGYTVEGFALGMEDSIGMVRQAADMLANSAVQTANSMNYYSPNGYGTTYNSTRQISAPISVNVNVTGGVDDVDSLAETIAQRINQAITEREEVFA